MAEVELSDWLPHVKPTALERGGLLIETTLAEGFELNRTLKCPTRILARLTEFGCRDFPKLYKKLGAFPWKTWVPDRQPIEFQASSSASRLKIKKRIEETCESARAKNLSVRGKPLPNPELPPAIAYVRLHDDVCTVSLDTSGEILHKRGQKPLVGQAPLRESIAASLLYLLESAGEEVSGEVELVDPMMGAGTFLVEAARLGVPASERGYAYQAFVPAAKKDWPGARLESRRRHPFGSFIGFEKDPRALVAAKENLSGVATSMEIRPEDFFEAKPLAATTLERWVIANPPYGERLKVEGRLSDYYLKFANTIETVARPARVCLLLPAKVEPAKLKWPKQWRLHVSRSFSNGGIPVVAMVFSRRTV
jgi:putative N6-adenine-specific DNA methylase